MKANFDALAEELKASSISLTNRCQIAFVQITEAMQQEGRKYVVFGESDDEEPQAGEAEYRAVFLGAPISGDYEGVSHGTGEDSNTVWGVTASGDLLCETSGGNNFKGDFSELTLSAKVALINLMNVYLKH